MSQKITTLAFLVLSLSVIQVEAQNTDNSTPVLVELFTSQGCSSCPPAETLLNSWGMELFKTKKALPLTYHVDYWDYLGWKDPFSSSFASQRQKNYASFFQTDSIYTPQLVINGHIGFNGADKTKAQEEVEKASATSISIPLKLVTQLILNTVRVNIALPDIIQNHLTSGSILHIVVFENDLKTQVEQGENRGVRLNEDFVVRYQTNVQGDDLKNRKIWKEIIPLNPQWQLTRSGVAVWLQDSQTMSIEGLDWIYPLLTH